MKKHLFLAIILFVVLGSCETEDPIPTYTLSTTILPSEGGKITVSPQSPNYKEGDVVTLTPEPNEHWVFKQWEGDGTGSTTPLQITMNANKSVVGVFVKRDYPLKITITGEGTVEEKIVTSPGGREYPHGTTVELTPKPKEGWVFESWEGDLTGTETPKTIKVDKEKNVTVKFKRRDYPLTITITGEGTVEEKIVTNPGGKDYPFETVVELTPKPKEGWVFESWSGDLTGTETPKTIKVDKQKNVTVKFKRRDYPLNITITGEGTVEEKIITNPGGKSYPFETVVELTPKPKEGWVFESWGGDLTGTETPKTIKVDKEKNVTVKFKRRDYQLNITITGEGTVEEKIITNPGGKSYPFETIVELTPKPKEGWVFESWGGDLTGTETPKTIKVDKEKNVTVKFYRLNPNFSLLENGITVICKNAVVGEKGIINGKTYEAVDRGLLLIRINERADLSCLCTSKVTDMQRLLQNSSFVPNVSSWDVSNVITMEDMFYGNSNFNGDLSNWDVGNVKNMSLMFNLASSFNANISKWNTKNVTNMYGMFRFAKSFNQDISQWNVGNVLTMFRMFEGAEAFNKNIGNWDVGNVTDMGVMFSDSKNFNQDISRWNVRKVTNMGDMFYSASSFNQNLSGWDVSSVNNCRNFYLDAIKWVLPKPNFKCAF